MPDLRVSVTLTLATDTPPSTVALTVAQAIVDQVPHRLESITWNGFDLDDEDDDGGGDAPPLGPDGLPGPGAQLTRSPL